MDEGKLPAKTEAIIGVAIMLILITVIHFVTKSEPGFIFVFGILIFFLIFSTINRKDSRNELKDFLKVDNDKYDSKIKLAKEIP